MRIEAFVLVLPGQPPIVSFAPHYTDPKSGGKWYKLVAEVPDPVPFETIEVPDRHIEALP